jgi:hypothetical protein
VGLTKPALISSTWNNLDSRPNLSYIGFNYQFLGKEAFMAAAKGNQYSANARLWASAIDKALEKRGKQLGRMGAMVELAEKLIEKAEQGDMQAIKELGDRIDGKARQQIEATGADGEALIPSSISIRFVESNKEDG